MAGEFKQTTDLFHRILGYQLKPGHLVISKGCV
jgi:hypothetical protein